MNAQQVPDAVGAIELPCRRGLRDRFEPAFVIATRVAVIIGIVTLIVVIVSVVRVSSARAEARQTSCIGTLVKSKGWMTDGLGADIGGICKLSRADAAAVLRDCGYGPSKVAGTVTDCPVECMRFNRVTSIRRTVRQ
jgi:hypothetical protein